MIVGVTEVLLSKLEVLYGNDCISELSLIALYDLFCI